MIAVIPVAGLGTRLLPASKAIPKEMLPILDKPIIQWVVEEAANAGIERVILITRFGKEAIENHFDTNFEVEHSLNNKGELGLLSQVTGTIPRNISIISVRQPRSKGLGDAILCAKIAAGKSPIAVLLPDILILQKSQNDLQRMIDRFHSTGKSQILVNTVPEDVVDQYGIVCCEQEHIERGQFSRITSMVEKPAPSQEVSRLSIVGRYILANDVFSSLKTVKPGVGGEIQLTDAINKMLSEPLGVEAFNMQGESYDCGNKVGFITANIAASLQNSSTAPFVKQFIRERFLD